jgi:hypothetical protein
MRKPEKTRKKKKSESHQIYVNRHFLIQAKTLKHKWTKYNMIRSSSVGPKESDMYRQTLHDQLHSIQYMDSE